MTRMICVRTTTTSYKVFIPRHQMEMFCLRNLLRCGTRLYAFDIETSEFCQRQQGYIDFMTFQFSSFKIYFMAFFKLLIHDGFWVKRSLAVPRIGVEAID